MRTTLLLCVITIFAFAGPSAWAAFHNPEDHTLDQRQQDWNFGSGVGGTTMMGQTFTAGSDGTLCHIQIGNTSGVPWGSLGGDPSQPVMESWPVVQIRNVVAIGDAYGPGSTILGSAYPQYPVPYYSDELEQWIAPDLSGSPGPVGWTPLIDFNIAVDAGVMYAIVLFADDYTGAVSVGATADYPLYATSPLDDPEYLDGDYLGGDLWTYTGGAWLNDPYVYDMQFRTYIVPVPLPAGVWLGICAVGVAGWHLKRRQMA